MKTLIHFGLISFFGCLSFLSLSAQDSPDEATFRSHASVALFISHAHVFEGRDAEGHQKALSLSSWGLDFNYHFSPHWAIGLHTDVIIEEFKAAGPEEETVEVSYPVAPALMGIYRPGKHWEFLLGAGVELEKEETAFLNRIGTEYSVELSHGWEMTAALTYDLKWESYDTWVIGLGATKAFTKE